ncbi:hypothetical protein SUGI_0605000 [Cryptomeria japonica]|nr:hypothetical protein SUGI_0605000 [Cryptomeria japonica]
MYNKSSGNTEASANGGHSEWRWPVPFLFGGFATIVLLIAFAVLVLARSYCKEQQQTQTGPDIIASNELAEISVGDEEQKVVVIMAGNETPTFFANPASSNLNLSQGV